MNPFDVGATDFAAATDYPKVETKPACLAGGHDRDEPAAVLDDLDQNLAGCLVIADVLVDRVAPPQLQRNGAQLV